MGWAACFIVLCLLARWNRCSWLCRDSRKQKDKGWMLVWYRYSYLNGICFVAGTIKRSTHLNIRQHICWWLPFFLWPMHASVQHLFNLFTLYMECRHSWQTGETPRTTKKMRGWGRDLILCACISLFTLDFCPQRISGIVQIGIKIFGRKAETKVGHFCRVLNRHYALITVAATCISAGNGWYRERRVNTEAGRHINQKIAISPKL